MIFSVWGLAAAYAVLLLPTLCVYSLFTIIDEDCAISPFQLLYLWIICMKLLQLVYISSQKKFVSAGWLAKGDFVNHKSWLMGLLTVRDIFKNHCSAPYEGQK